MNLFCHSKANLRFGEIDKRKLIKSPLFPITGYINRQNENLLDNIIDRIEYFKGFISKIEEKLKNDSFINKAPESIIKREKQKLEDSKSQLLLLQEKMRTITNE